MYKTVDYSQHSFLDFNQPLGLHMDPENRWIKMADSIPWDVFEEKWMCQVGKSIENFEKQMTISQT